MKKLLTGVAGATLALLLSACGDMNLKKYNPFSGDPVQERSRTPAHAAEYQCAAGKRIYVRTQDAGEAIWLILPERELRVDRVGSTTRYSKGNTVLELNGSNATVSEGAAVTYSACKTDGAGPAPAK